MKNNVYPERTEPEFCKKLHNIFPVSRGETKTDPLCPTEQYIAPQIYCKKLFFFPSVNNSDRCEQLPNSNISLIHLSQVT